MSIKTRFLRAGFMAGAIAIAAVIAFAGLRAYAAEQEPSPAEQQIKYRKALYVVMAGNFGPAYAPRAPAVGGTRLAHRSGPRLKKSSSPVCLNFPALADKIARHKKVPQAPGTHGASTRLKALE
jgi:hypothetical protein